MRKTLTLAALGFMSYVVLTAFLGSLLKLNGTPLWIFRGLLWMIGLLAIAAVMLFLRKKGTAKPVASAKADEIDLAVRNAEQKLAGAETPAKIGSLPVIFLLGETGSAKTSVLVRSGLDAELLAGQVYRDNNIVPTPGANLWFGQRAIFAEIGGKLLGDQAACGKLIRRLQPGKLAAAFGSGGQAPRAAVVCFDVETFTRPGSIESAAATARLLRARLGDISTTLGIHLPVYVLFTRLDRVPFFTEFVGHLTNEEATQILGVPLPLSPGGGTGLYAEEQGTRLNAAFDELFRSLAGGRPELLAREHDAANLGAIYEFPREFRKLRGPLVEFLVALCRPSQLTIGPFLRGFYFTGIRPVVVSEAAPAPAAAASAPESGQPAGAWGATGIFRAGSMPSPAAPVATPSRAPITRRVPQWVFLGRFFPSVLLTDRVAMGASGASVKTNLLRRVLLASAAVLCLVASTGFLVSYLNNRALETAVTEAAAGTPAVAITGDTLPSIEPLRRLESLRQSLETLTTYHREGAPFWYRWGLYVGEELYPRVRRLYFDRFHGMLLGQTQTIMLDSMRALPAKLPGPDYGYTYETLRAYLITTSEHKRSTVEFLAPVLTKRWSANRAVDPERLKLAQKQFEFYSGELPLGNPFSPMTDDFTVEKARRYLALFGSFERIYQGMLAGAAKNNPPINFNKRFPEARGVVEDPQDVSGAFTKNGWEFMKTAVQHPDRTGEAWVLGEESASNLDPGKLSQQLRDRYYADYIAQWRAYLRSASVVKYKDLADAAQKLTQISGNRSPLLALFWLASQNTAVDAKQVADVFQPVHTVVPPASGDRYIGPTNQNYVNSLLTLQASIDSVAKLPAWNDAAAATSLNDATAAGIEVKKVAQGFQVDREGRVDAIVQKLMEDPITHADAMLRAGGGGDLNGKGKDLCAQMRPLWNKYPFNPKASAEATVADVNGVFRKPDGALWAFYQTHLQKLLTLQGTQYVPVPNTGVALTPAFVHFFNQAAALSNMLYAGNTPDPHFTYTLKPVPADGMEDMTVDLTIDGQKFTYTGGAAPPHQFQWLASGAHGVSGTLRFDRTPLEWVNYTGLWAVFRLIDKADRAVPYGAGQLLDWTYVTGKDSSPLRVNGKPVTVRLELGTGGLPLFQKGFAARMSCISEVAK